MQKRAKVLKIHSKKTDCIFSKRQALSRAVVVNSNMSGGKYLAREGPGSRLDPHLAVLAAAQSLF